MPAQYFVPGPAEVAVGTGGNVDAKTMQFLGYTREGVHVTEQILRRPVICDLGGPEMPSDMLIIGKMVTLSMQVVRFDPAVMLALRARHYIGSVGSIGANEIGTLLMAEKSHFPLMVRSRYAGKSIFQGNLPGIRVHNAFLDQGHSYPLHTQEQVHQLVFTGLVLMDPATLTGMFWDSTMSGYGGFPTPT